MATRSETSYQKAVLRLAAVLLAYLPFAAAQTTITSIQAGEGGKPPMATNIRGITSGTYLEGGLVLYVHGIFTDPESTLWWCNPNAVTTAEAGSHSGCTAIYAEAATPTDAEFLIPASLYCTPVDTLQTVEITIEGPDGESDPKEFLLYPPLSSLGSLPIATVGVSYSGAMVTGGTPPYTVATEPPVTGTIPPGLAVNDDDNQFLAGTPTEVGGYTFTPTIQDAWGNTISDCLNIQVIANATLSSLSPSSVPAGSVGLILTVNGANFLSSESPAGRSQVQWTFGDETTFLHTTFVSSTKLKAFVPYHLLAAPGVASVAVLQPNDLTSTPVSFTVASPSIISLSPVSTVMGSGAITLAVTGANFAPSCGSGNITVVFGSTSLTTTFVDSGHLTAQVPASLLTTPGVYGVTVVNPGGVVSNSANFTVNSNLTITIVTLPQATVGTPYQVHLTGSGGQGTLTWSATGLPAGLTINPQGIISGTPLTTGTFPVVAKLMDSTEHSVQSTLNLSVIPSLSITTTALPAGTVGVVYQAHLTSSGGQGTITWSASNLPAGLIISGHGDITGTPSVAGTFPITVRVTDSGNYSVQTNISFTVFPAEPTITTPSTLPNGTVGTPYLTSIAVTGDGPYEFSLTSGALPDGLSLSKSGGISGTPTKTGTFRFVVTANDSKGNAPGKGFTLAISPASLAIPGNTSPAPVGTAVSFNLSATGGTPPYRYTLGCALPQGLSFSSGTISGTPATPGLTPCRLVAVDSIGASTSKDFTITITEAGFVLPGGALPDGQTGIAYSAQIAATGGAGPITYSATGIPDGLTLASSGAITGTPATAGSFTIAATATDATGAQANASYTLTVRTGKLTVTTTSLAAGIAGTPYSAMLNAGGGVKPYSWTVANLPHGLTAMPEGVISGRPDVTGAFTLNVTVKDAAGTSASANLTLAISAGTLVISTSTVPDGTVGTAYSATFAATGGQGSFTWSASGLPGGLTLSPAGVLSGTPSAPVTASITVSVTDNTGAAVQKTFALRIALPAAPQVSFAGIGSISNPLQQPALGLSLGSLYPVDVVATLTLTFQPDSGADDPTIVFSNGTRTITITIPAGSTAGLSQVGVQTGSVAGLITITAQLQAAGQDVTPQPAPQSTIRINPAAPLISSVIATRSTAGLTVTIAGLTTTREISQAVFQFNAAPGSNLQTTSLTVTVDSLFSAYFSSAASAPFGSQFVLNQPFNVTGSAQDVASVTVTLTNRLGTSTAVTANVN